MFLLLFKIAPYPPVPSQPSQPHPFTLDLFSNSSYNHLIHYTTYLFIVHIIIILC